MPQKNFAIVKEPMLIKHQGDSVQDGPQDESSQVRQPSTYDFCVGNRTPVALFHDLTPTYFFFMWYKSHQVSLFLPFP